MTLKRCYILPLVAIVFFTTIKCSVVYNASDVEQILKDIPVEELTEFLRYYLNQGYHYQQLSEGIVVPKVQKLLTLNQAVDLYNYFLDNYQISDEEQTEQLRDIICFPQGCIDIGDNGVHP